MKRYGISVFLMCLLLAGCATSGWQTEFDSAQKAAKRQNKDILLAFGRSDTDQITQMLKKEILDSKDFTKEIQKNFIPVYLDLPASEGIIEADQLEKNTITAQKYALQTFPTVYLLTPDGDVYGTIEYDLSITSPEQFMSLLGSFTQEKAARQDAKKQIAAAAGVEKAKLIDAMYDNTQPQYQALLIDYIKQIPVLDPNNTTGLRNKYEFLIAYIDALNLYLEGKPDKSAQLFADAAKSPYISEAEKQSAYNTAISLYASSDSKDSNARITDLLFAMVAADPNAPDFKTEIAAAAGIEKAKLIDEFMNHLDPSVHLFLKDFIKQMPSLDPDNTLGLLGKYEFLNAYIDAQDFYAEGDMKKASDIFAQTAENKYLSPAEKQEAYHMAAALYPLESAADGDIVIALLEKAIAADPSNENTPQIKDTIAQIKTMAAMTAAQSEMPQGTNAPVQE